MAKLFSIPYDFTKADQCPSEGVNPDILAWISARDPSSITVVKVGDYYEAYLEDAVLLARIEELVLTSKSAGDAGVIPLCGFPYFSLDRHIRQLASAGIILRVL